VEYTWNNILTFTFNELGIGGTPNNTLTIKTDPSYDNKTLTELNNNFVDSLTLFNTENILNRLMDVIYGSISSNIGKSLKQLETEAQINAIIDKMSNNVNINTIEDSAFDFTNEEIYRQQQEAEKRKCGQTLLQTSNTILSEVPITYLTDFNNQISLATNQEDKKRAVSDGLNNMANASVANVTNPTDVSSTKLDFIQQILNNFIKAIVGVILTPKVALIFIVNYKIIYGQSASFSSPLDFIKKNKNLINNIVIVITKELIKILLLFALSEISKLVSKAIAKKQKEKNLNRLAQLQTLIGIPFDIVRNLINII
jgi:hypothetical protein